MSEFDLTLPPVPEGWFWRLESGWVWVNTQGRGTVPGWVRGTGYRLGLYREGTIFHGNQAYRKDSIESPNPNFRIMLDIDGIPTRVLPIMTPPYADYTTLRPRVMIRVANRILKAKARSDERSARFTAAQTMTRV